MLSIIEIENITDGKEFEIIDGKAKKRSFGEPFRGRIQINLATKIHDFAEKNCLGEVYLSTHFAIGNDFYVPSVAFVAFDNFPESGEPQGFWNIAPDLAVEIIVQTDDYKNVSKKVDEYFAANVKQVWLILPETQTLTIYRSRKDATILTETDEFVCDDLLTGFRLKLTEIFHAPNKAAAS